MADFVIEEKVMPTYPFSDPDPVASANLKLYPYWRFDGQASFSVPRKWTIVKLTNGIVEVSLMPEIGGKVWGAKDLGTGRDFIYTNDAVKFRDIALRGPWSSGGIEFNFCVVGHAQWTSMPVDWHAGKSEDGKSVFYRCGGFEWSCRTYWMVEIELSDGDNFFTQKVYWRNLSSLPAPRYQWSNSAVTARGNPEFVYPGRHQIFHDGTPYAWPVDEKGVDRSKYANSGDIPAASWHVIDGDNGFLGAWYPEWKFGMWHRNDKDAIFGRKIFMWSQARSGAIWEDNLTDNAGQYVELRSGRGMQQQTPGAEKSPFKMDTLYPGDTDIYEQRWGFSRDENLFREAAGFPSEEIRRPVQMAQDCDLESAFMLCRRGEQTIRLNGDLAAGEKLLREALAKDPCYVPAISELAALELRRGDYAAAEELAQRALSIDAYDGAANYYGGVAAAARHKGRSVARARERFGVATLDARFRDAAKTAMAELDGRLAVGPALSPSPFAILAEWKNEGGRLVDKFVCERPEESIVELALMHERAGLLDEAARILREAGDYPVALIHLWGITGDSACLARAASADIAFVFAFRHETIALLRAAADESDSWKFRYYLAVALSALGKPDDAAALLDACGTAPDSAVFYLYRASRRSREAALADLEKASAISDCWRAGRAKVTILSALSRHAEAVETAMEYIGRFPQAQPLRIAYAEALYAAGRYLECVTALRKMHLLLDEFGRVIQDIWITSNVKLAEESLGRGDAAETGRFVDAALEFPENIGLGKPENMREQLEKWIPEPLRKYWSGE